MLRKLLTILACSLSLVSFGLNNSAPEDETPNASWIEVYINDSLVWNSINAWDDNLNYNPCLLKIDSTEYKPTDKIKIKLHSDFYCSQKDLIIVKDLDNNILKKITETIYIDFSELYQLAKQNDLKMLRIDHIYSCDFDKDGMIKYEPNDNELIYFYIK